MGFKTKCLHDTWYLAKVKTPAKTPKNSRRKSGGKPASARVVNKKLRVGTEDAVHISAPSTNADLMGMFSGPRFGGAWVALICHRSGGFQRCDPDR